VYVDPYLPVIDEYGTYDAQFTLGIVRQIMLVYVLFVHIPVSIKYEWKEGHSWRHYILRARGMADVAIVGLCFSVFFIRFLLNSVFAPSTLEYVRSHYGTYQEVVEDVEIYQVEIILDGIVFALVVFRLAVFCRLNRVTFVLHQTISQALTVFDSFLLVLLPLIFGLIALGEAAWRTYIPSYRTWWTSFVTTLMQLQGEATPYTSSPDEDVRNPLNILFYAFVWTVIYKFIIMNSWIAIVAAVYQRNRAHHGYRPSDEPYRWNELRYAQFLCFAPIAKRYSRLRGIEVTKADDDD
jgi:hypothetical protein